MFNRSLSDAANAEGRLCPLQEEAPTYNAVLLGLAAAGIAGAAVVVQGRGDEFKSDAGKTDAGRTDAGTGAAHGDALNLSAVPGHFQGCRTWPPVMSYPAVDQSRVA